MGGFPLELIGPDVEITVLKEVAVPVLYKG
jgi:hypothetical protein